MKLREVLSAPFLLRSESVELDDETWVRVVSYPELGCREAGRSMPEVMERLEASKLRVLLDRCLAGTLPPLREAVPDPTVELRLARAGLESFIPRLNEDVTDLARSEATRAGNGPRPPG
ncbi:MAG: hypothetical protein J2O39_00545 [Acidimicrobiales bacterium]|nr:hypothetical protein [Acidimicrobiales bacterium]